MCMYRKIDVSVSEMKKMREQGLSNKDIAHTLDISVQTVLKYIGPQGRRMESMKWWDDKPAGEAKEPEVLPEIKRAVDMLRLNEETVASADGNFSAIIDYRNHTALFSGGEIDFANMPELATFVIGITERVEKNENHN